MLDEANCLGIQSGHFEDRCDLGPEIPPPEIAISDVEGLISTSLPAVTWNAA